MTFDCDIYNWVVYVVLVHLILHIPVCPRDHKHLLFPMHTTRSLTPDYLGQVANEIWSCFNCWDHLLVCRTSLLLTCQSLHQTLSRSGVIIHTCNSRTLEVEGGSLPLGPQWAALEFQASKVYRDLNQQNKNQNLKSLIYIKGFSRTYFSQPSALSFLPQHTAQPQLSRRLHLHTASTPTLQTFWKCSPVFSI